VVRWVGADSGLPLVPIEDDTTDIVDEMCGGYVDDDEGYVSRKSEETDGCECEYNEVKEGSGSYQHKEDQTISVKDLNESSRLVVHVGTLC